jgi:phosphate transport system protein
MPFASRHTSHSYEAEISELRHALGAMGQRCRAALKTAVLAVRTGSRELARQVIGLDRAVNDDEKAIDALAVRILALRQPVACDLRLLAMSLKLVTDLERIGDEAVNIAERAEEGPLAADAETFADLDRMGEEAQRMVASALDAFLEGDDAGAREVLLRDDLVDELYGKTMRAMEEYMTAHPAEVRAALCVMSVAKYLERVADHATNVAEEVIFMVRGDDVRHAKSVDARAIAAARAAG